MREAVRYCGCPPPAAQQRCARESARPRPRALNQSARASGSRARVFIGANATILPGVTVGDDAIVGAGSVVRRDVSAGTVVFGNPAEDRGSTERHTERHLATQATRPRYGDLSLLTLARRTEILAEMERGPGYVD